jgi:hypothetical protein
VSANRVGFDFINFRVASKQIFSDTMLFRLAVVSSALAFASAQEPDPNQAFEMPLSADAMRASGVNVMNSNAAGVMTVRQRDTATFDFRWTLDGVSGEMLTAGYVHCPLPTAGSTTDVADSARTLFSTPHLENEGESIVGSTPQLINWLTGNLCYLNLTTAANPMGELRGNIQSDLINSDVEQARGGNNGNSASTLVTATSIITSMVAAVAALL